MLDHVRPETPGEFERMTYYLRQDQIDGLDILMLKLRIEKRIRLGKSELARLAMDWLLSLDLDQIVESVQRSESVERATAS